MSGCIPEPLATNSKEVTGQEFCTVWADKFLVCGGVHPPSPFRRGIVIWRQSPPTPAPQGGGNCHPSGGGGMDKGRGRGGLQCYTLDTGEEVSAQISVEKSTSRTKLFPGNQVSASSCDESPGCGQQVARVFQCKVVSMLSNSTSSGPAPKGFTVFYFFIRCMWARE